VEKIDGRRKLKRGYEYEVQWKNLPMDKNEWLTRDQLEEMGESLHHSAHACSKFHPQNTVT